MLRASVVAASLASLLLAPTPATAWQRRLRGTVSAGPIAVDRDGNVFAAVYTNPALDRGHIAHLELVKLAARNGAERWRSVLPAAGDRDTRNAMVAGLAFHPTGDVLVAGTFTHGRGNDLLRVERHAGRSGRIRWRRTVRGDVATGNASAAGLAVDRAGDVVVGGAVTRGGGPRSQSEDLLVVKYAGADGAERWRYQLDGGANLQDGAIAVAVDWTGDVLVLGGVSTGPSSGAVFVLKLAAADGAVLWRSDLSFGGQLLSMTRRGDVLVADGLDCRVAKLSDATGEIAWATPVSGCAALFGVGDLPSGDVAAYGLVSYTGRGMLAVGLDGPSGAERWRQVFGGVFDIGGQLFATSSNGRVFVGGQLLAGPTCYDAFAAELDGDTGAIDVTTSFDGTATARMCDRHDCGGEEPGPCGPSPDGIDQDLVSGLAAAPNGRMVVAGTLDDGPHGRPHGFVATVSPADP